MIWPGSELCLACGAAVHPREERLCAHCRMAHRGDNVLVAHRRGGYLDGGPCRCGCVDAAQVLHDLEAWAVA